MRPLERFLRRARLLVVRQAAVTWAARGLAAAAVLALSVELLARRWPVDPVWPALAACGAVGVVLAVGGWFRAWPSLAQVARLADTSLHGRERFSTALEFATAGGSLVELQRADALRWARAS